MRSLLFSSCLLLGLTMACSPTAEPSAIAAPVGEPAPETPAVQAEVSAAPAAVTFASLLARYPVEALPRDYTLDDRGSFRAYEKRPLSEAQAALLVGPEKIETNAGDLPFALERLSLEGDVTALVTYFKGSTTQQIVLSTHMPDGSMISQFQVAMHSNALTYGYSTSLSINQHLSRAVMITNDAGQPDVDSFDDFVIESDGRISMTER